MKDKTKYKRQFVSFFAVLFIACMVPVTAFAQEKLLEPTTLFYVADYANVLEEDTIQYIVSENEALSANTGAQIVIVTVNSLNGMDAEDYAYQVFKEWGIGSAGEKNGVLLLLSVGEKKCRVIQGQGLKDTLTSETLQDILNNEMKPDFDANRFDAGVKKTFEAILQRINQIDKFSSTADTENLSSSYAQNANQVQQEKASGSGFGTLFIIAGLIVLISTFGRSRRRSMQKKEIYTRTPNVWSLFTQFFYPSLDKTSYKRKLSRTPRISPDDILRDNGQDRDDSSHSGLGN